jgi:hypothetical protein
MHLGIEGALASFFHSALGFSPTLFLGLPIMYIISLTPMAFNPTQRAAKIELFSFTSMDYDPILIYSHKGIVYYQSFIPQQPNLISLLRHL